MRSVVTAASLGLAAGQGARNMFAPVPPGQGQVYTNQYPTQYVQYDAATQYAYEQPVRAAQEDGWPAGWQLVMMTAVGAIVGTAVGEADIESADIAAQLAGPLELAPTAPTER